MGRPNAKVLRAREHNAKMWRKEQGEKGGNHGHCCDNVAHQKSHQPNVRDGKVGVSRLPEEPDHHHRCAEADLGFEKVLTDFPTISFVWIIHIKLIGPLL